MNLQDAGQCDAQFHQSSVRGDGLLIENRVLLRRVLRAVGTDQAEFDELSEVRGIAGVEQVAQIRRRHRRRRRGGPGFGDHLLQAEDFGEVVTALHAGQEVADVADGEAPFEQVVDDFQAGEVRVGVDRDTAAPDGPG